jgi:alpha-glucoside transport system permease protein
VALPALLPAGALVLIIVLVAAVRVFELVLAAAPGAVQGQVDVVGVHLWRFGPLLGTGESAALAVVLFLLVAIVALAGLWGLRREWPAGRPAGLPAGPAVTSAAARLAPAATPAPASHEAARRWGLRAFAGLAVAVWAVPLAVLLLTSLHAPLAAATAGWWSGGWGWGSFQAAFADGMLLSTLGSTAVRALVAAALLLVLAVPAAYGLAWGGLPRPLVRSLVAAATVLAVLPPQVVATPLGYSLDHLQLLGAATPLILVHVAFGVPLAILLLRGAFASVPRDIVSARQLDPVRGSALFAVITRCWPALLTVAVLEIVLVWNDLVIGLLFGGTEAGSVTLVLFEQTRQFATSAGPMAADAVVITLLPLILVLATGRWLVRGLAEGVRR